MKSMRARFDEVEPSSNTLVEHVIRVGQLIK